MFKHFLLPEDALKGYPPHLFLKTRAECQA